MGNEDEPTLAEAILVLANVMDERLGELNKILDNMTTEDIYGKKVLNVSVKKNND